MSTTQDIAAIAKKALEDVNNATESDWPGILAGALESIVELCQFEQMDAAKARQSPANNQQFSGFAKAVVDKMLSKHDGMTDTSDWWQEQARAIVAQAAYDLVKSACIDINNVQMRSGVKLHPNAMLREVEDMPVLPEENNASTD